MSKHVNWSGVFPAVTTQFNADFSVNLEETHTVISNLVRDGVSGLVVCGSVGENTSLTIEEKMAVTEVAKDASGGRVPVICGIAEFTSAGAAKVAKAVERVGVDGIMVMPALVYSSKPHETAEHFRSVASGTDLPVMVYNNPPIYRNDVTPDILVSLADCENIVCFKDSSGDTRRFIDVRNQVGERFILFAGLDDVVLESVAVGAQGWRLQADVRQRPHPSTAPGPARRRSRARGADHGQGPGQPAGAAERRLVANAAPSPPRSPGSGRRGPAAEHSVHRPQGGPMPSILGHNYVGGARSAAGNLILRSLDADSGEALPYAFVQATAAEVDAAARAAERAYPHYRQLSATRRAGFLEAIASRLDALGDDFVALVRRETALPAVRIQGERTRTANQLRLFAEVLRRGDFHGARIDRGQPGRTPPRPDLRQWRIGLGPVAVFGASNFPLAFSTAGGDSAAALAAGCPVVVKAHGGHMATAECVADAILQAAADSGMPDGVFNMVYGNGVGEALVRHPAIRAVGFTGSLKGGRALCDLAAARPQPIPVFAEMSSINPLVVLPEALRRRGRQVAEELAASVTLGCGQFCTKPGLVLGLRSPGFDAFVAALGEALAARPAQSMLNAGTLRSYIEGLQRLERHPGIRRLAGAPQEGRQAHPQLFKADVGLLLEGDELLQEEVFGPATVVVEAADEEQLARALDNLHGQLTATLIGEADDLAAFAGLVPLLERKAGRLLFNGYPTGVEVCDAMVHGGPYPATSDARGTSVGTLAIERFLRPLCYQDYPDSLLPDALKNANPLGLLRLVDGRSTREALD